MPILIAVLLGVVEGLTEYLPVSSTGHLVLVSRVLGRQAGSYEIVIQLGAILAVVVHYRVLLLEQLRRRDVRFFASLLVGFMPVAVIGKLAGHAIKEHLFHPTPIAIALAVGGVVMIVVERLRKNATTLTGLEHVTPVRAVYIGFGQCFALFPGASRSMCTIVAGQLTGLSTATAAEFSFLLGIPTLGAACLYEGFKSRHELAHDIGGASMAVGLVTSFFVAWAVVATFLRYLKSHGLEPFGWYRILLAIAVLKFM